MSESTGTAALRGNKTARTLPETRSPFARLLPKRWHRSRRNPLVDEGEPGYIPTVEVIALVRSNFEPAYIRAQVHRWLDGTTFADMDELDGAVVVEITCRELLASQRWLYSNR